jgi:hypothetical protein
MSIVPLLKEIIVAVLVFVGVASLRFLSLTGLPDDHYVHLAGAQQMLHGGWPSRDFVDPGLPLTFAVSAAAQALFGEAYLTEAVLMSLAFGVAGVITLRAGVVLTGSILLGLAAALIEVLVFPRSYSYPKMLVYATAALALVWYSKKPSRARVIALAALSIVVLLVRHDHAVYVGIAALAAVVLSPVPFERSPHAGSVALLGAAVVVMVLPYLIYLETAGGGLIAHLERGAAFTAAEVHKQRLTLTGHPPYVAWLLWAAWLAPMLSLALIAARVARRADSAWDEVRRVGPIVVLAIVANAGLIRDQLHVRLPDAIVPPALLIAWLVRQAWLPRPPLVSMPLRLTCTAALLATIGCAAILGNTPEQLDRAGVFNGLARLPERFGERAQEMRRPWVGRQVPSTAVKEMRPFFDYAGRCLGPDDRLLIVPYLPEIPVLSGHPFAGGQIWLIPGVLATADDHARVMRRLHDERVPIAVLRRPAYDDLTHEFPELGAYVTERFTPVAQWSLGDNDTITLLASTGLSAGSDAATGWPCFH